MSRWDMRTMAPNLKIRFRYGAVSGPESHGTSTEPIKEDGTRNGAGIVCRPEQEVAQKPLIVLPRPRWVRKTSVMCSHGQDELPWAETNTLFTVNHISCWSDCSVRSH